ncbi:GNAT family N-acetyltransferase [Streptomyces sp. NBC_01511]|uniref:GNAT family N-acetyltransferase n=1 Tax=unclassified Streptomyces TaxID=2593676 RepID=UPI00386340F9
MTARSPVTLSVAGSIDEPGAGQWDELAEAAGASVFYGSRFLSSVERAPLSSPSEAMYLLGHDPAGRLVAALPLYLQQTVDPFAADASAGPVNALLGHVWHCYDTALLSRGPLGPGLVAQFWEALEELAGKYDAELWGLVNVPMEEPLARHLAANGVRVEETVPRYRLPLADGPRSLDEHLAGVGRASRRTLRQYWRRAERAGAVVTVREGREVLDEAVLGLCLATADKHAPGYYPPDRLSALVERLGADCRIIRVELDGELLAASVCMLDRTRMHAWAGGCAYPAELNWSPQYVLFAAELRAGIESGLAVLECGRRNDAFKTRYGLRAHRLGRAVRRRDT